ncbi:MAG TPA: FAD-dependent oxidoreductase [Sediminibacterium sp.]
MQEDKFEYDWAVVGGGVVGVFIAEILTREGHSVVLIEKNEKLASETTREFHEWIHMGSLYTLIPDNLMTLKFLLGAIDDILDYYGSYKGMNLVPTERGMDMKDVKGAWFNRNYIHFKFRIGQRKITFPWLFGIARAVFLIDRIKEHDWLRKRGGILDPFKLKPKVIFGILMKLIRHPHKFYDYETPDFTTNSRNLLNDILIAAKNSKLRISAANEFIDYTKEGSDILVNGKRESFKVKNIVFSNGENMASQIDSRVKVSYAPMAVIKNVSKETNSFVELDYYPKNCINILTKEDGVALIGGISFSNIDKCDKYIDEVIEKHKEYNPNLEVLHKYTGKKSEIVLNQKDNRNYLYHILNIQNNVWGIIPGKFTLAFSIAPEFYRRVYKRNPSKINPNVNTVPEVSEFMSNTVWHDVSQNK